MLVLGLDPGSRLFGWGLIQREGSTLRHVAHGVIQAGVSSVPLADRLLAIEQGLEEVVKAYPPAEASIEALFFAKDPHAAATLGHARGVGLLVCARHALPLTEYAPTLIKQTTTGTGRADKSQVAQMIRTLLGLSSPPPPDAADALAIAFTHLLRHRHRTPTR